MGSTYGNSADCNQRGNLQFLINLSLVDFEVNSLSVTVIMFILFQ